MSLESRHRIRYWGPVGHAPLAILDAMSRLEKFARVLDTRGVDVYLCSSAITMGYLADFFEEGGERLLVLAVSKTGQVRALTPSLAKNQAERSGLKDVRTWSDGDDPMKLVMELVNDWSLHNSVIAVDDETRASLLIELQKVVPDATFIAGQPVLSDLMRIKDAQEIAWLKKAGAAADDSLAPVLQKIRVGTIEEEVNQWLQQEMQRNGGTPAFCIVATGSHGAEPHHMTGTTKIQKGDVLVMDYGCSIEGYKSDITRTVVVGEGSDEQNKVYETVYAAFMAARNAIKPGVAAEDIDRAARKVIEDAGYGEYFVHRTGHGLGMRIHEEPYICAGNKHKLEVGNVFSIEPGIYLPGRFGVRIENIVAVTENGHESMNAEPSPTMLVVPV